MNIYDLRLHQSFEELGLHIVRVPGGWIYYTKELKVSEDGIDRIFSLVNPVFVPWHPEFRPQVPSMSETTTKHLP